MDFKSLLNTIDSMQERPVTPAAPTLEKAVQLNEDAQMRVLAGTASYISEAKKKEAVEEELEVGQSKKTAAGGTVTKTATGIIHKGKKYGGEEEKSEDEEDAPKAKKAKKESIEEASEAQTAARAKFMAMVKGKKGAKKDDKKADKKDDKKAAPKKGVNPFAKKKTVKESIEPKLTFKDMIKLVQESGGQQQIDPVDAALFAWAQRIASTKFTESTKAELYAGVVYERMGGVFQMYDVLAESNK